MDYVFPFLIQIFSSIIVSTFIIKCWYTCLKKPIKIWSLKNMFLVFFITLVMIIPGIFVPNTFRMMITYLILILTNYFFVSKNIRDSVILTIISEMIILVSEFTFVIILSFFVKSDIDKFVAKPVVFFILNCHIVLMSFLSLKIKVPQRIYGIVLNKVNYIKNNEILLYSIIIIGVLIISTTESYIKLPLVFIILTNIIMAILFIFIIIRIVTVKSNYNKVSDKYQTSISSLKEHESLINKFRINNHENKNELLTIRNMSSEKKIISYIDKLIDNKIKDSEKIVNKISKIPAGGLRATIYSKLCLMEKNKITYKLEVAKDVKTVDLINMDETLVVDICRILGVFLDNSIEAVDKLKTKKIIIELYLVDNYLYVDISNSINNDINLDKINDEGYTTKGKGRGYGLLLVKKIIKDNNGLLVNETSIDGNMFTQSLIIKNIK